MRHLAPALLLVVLGLGACKRPAPAERPPLSSFQREPTATLMVTWFVPDHPATASQKTFQTKAGCEAARDVITASAAKFAVDQKQRNASEKAQVLKELAADGCGFGCSPSAADLKRMAGAPIPQVSAVCVSDG